MDYAKGDKYEGEWDDDKRNGQGNHLAKPIGQGSFANGDKYDGEWNNDVPNGKGKTQN